MTITVDSFTPATPEQAITGLGGYLRLSYGGLILDGITVRRTSDGRLTLSFPARTDRSGARHPYIRPVDDAARESIEHDVFRQLTQKVSP